MDAATVMDLLKTHLHAQSSMVIGLIDRMNSMTANPEVFPPFYDAARELVRIGVLRVVTDGDEVDFFNEPRFIFVEEPRKAIARWVCSLNN